jgi:putative nucleotidyltransferase with HDIG domain/PAS domain S-box-containing protein
LTTPIENLLAQTINISEIPALPEAARWAIYTTLTMDISAEHLSNIIKANPSLALKILKIANSPVYTRDTPIATIKDAIILLGYKTIKGIILSVTIKDLFTEKQSGWFNYKGFWLHSVATAFVSEEIAKLINYTPDDAVYAAGLLHDIGKIIFLLSAEEQYSKVIEAIEKENLTFNRAEMKIFGFDHTDVSDFLFGHWKLPEKLTLPIQEHHKQALSQTDGYITAAHILKISNEIAHIAGFPSHKNEPAYEVSETILLNLGIMNEDLDIILQNLKENISSLVGILNLPKTDVKGYFEVLSSANKELGKMHLVNQQMVQELKTKKSIVSELNKLSILFLKEKDIETALGTALRITLHNFRFSSVACEFYLNSERSIFYKVFFPKLYTEDGKIITSLEIEERKKIIIRDAEDTSGLENNEHITLFFLESGKGEELGKLFVESDIKIEAEELRIFFDQFALGLNNIKLHLTNKIKTEKLNIAIKQLKDENERGQRLARINELILESSPLGILSINEEGLITTFNKKAQAIMGQDLQNSNFFQLDLIIKNNLQGTLSRIVKQEKSGDVTFRKAGQDLPYHLDTNLITGTGQLLISIHDISERVEDEKSTIQREKMVTLGELAAGIAHNLRSPLAVVKGIPELIISDLEEKNLRIIKRTGGREEEDSEVRENMEMISKSVEKVFAIIDSIMDFSKMETGTFEATAMDEIISEVYLLLERRLKEKQISFKNNTSGLVIFGNRNMLVQIFLNLMANSIDAVSDEGTIEITGKREKDRLIIHFLDDGKGIGADDFDRIFEPFYTTSGKANGSGIGLSVTRTMVNLHGGSIKALPNKSGGTIIEIIFPVEGS